jgi:hypothetical protein
MKHTVSWPSSTKLSLSKSMKRKVYNYGFRSQNSSWASFSVDDSSHTEYSASQIMYTVRQISIEWRDENDWNLTDKHKMTTRVTCHEVLFLTHSTTTTPLCHQNKRFLHEGKKYKTLSLVSHQSSSQSYKRNFTFAIMLYYISPYGYPCNTLLRFKLYCLLWS